MLPEITDKEIDVESAAAKVIEDRELLPELLDGLTAKDETIRYNCSRVLTIISEEYGTVLYPEWGYFFELLKSKNAYHRMSSLQIIANLTRVDTDNKFEGSFDEYYSLLRDRGTVVAAHLAANSGKIARAKPHLQAKITGTLLNIDSIHPGKQVEMVKSYVIAALDEYFEEAAGKDEIIEFVKKQLNSESPKTRKQAGSFLSKYAGK